VRAALTRLEAADAIKLTLNPLDQNATGLVAGNLPGAAPDPALLAALTGLRPAAMLGALREALTAGLLTEDGDRLAFRHDLVREAVDASLPGSVRQSLRRRAVTVILPRGQGADQQAREHREAGGRGLERLRRRARGRRSGRHL
jgi:hypothetical protein